MERLHGPISPYFLGENLNAECLEQANGLNFAFGSFLTSEESMRFAEPFSSTSYGVDKMPVLQMLGVEAPSITPSTEPNFQLLLKVQQLKKPMTTSHFLESDSRIPPFELESCVTHVSESHSPAKSETKNHPNPPWSPCPEVVSSVRNLEPNSPEIYKRTRSSPIQIPNQTDPQFAKPSSAREKKKRKRTRPLKNSEEVESQRMTHIAVERNRRKQMNDHLAALRSLMPSSFVHRGDQASIVGGAIDFVKELEQFLQSLQAQKQMGKSAEESYGPEDSTATFSGFFTSPQYTAYSSQEPHLNFISSSNLEGGERDSTAETNSMAPNIEVTVIQTHVNLKILSPKRSGQLIRAIAALEDLFLTILHLNVTSLEHSVLHSFSLKIEEGCKLRSADEIARAVHQIFSIAESN